MHGEVVRGEAGAVGAGARAPRQLHARRRAEVVLEDAPAGGAVDATAAVRHLYRDIK